MHTRMMFGIRGRNGIEKKPRNQHTEIFFEKQPTRVANNLDRFYTR